MKTFALHLLTALSAAALTWYLLAGRTGGAHDHAAGLVDAAAPKLLYYQSPMHPWVKSERPGQCTVCGMDLVPVYENQGGAGDAAASSQLVLLPPGSPNVIGVATSSVSREKLVRTLRVSGTIEDDDSRHRILSAYTQGRVEKLFVNYEGAEVQAGQPMALFYSPALLNAATDYKIATAQNDLRARAGAASRLKQLGMTDAQIEKVPARQEGEMFFEILAPLGGTVVRRQVYEGQYVQEGAPLFEIADFSKMWFQFIAYEQDLPFLKPGQRVEISVPSLPEGALQAAITFINPNMDDMTRSARIRVEVDNGGRKLRHRVYAQAAVHLDAPEALSVPKSAVLWSGGDPRLYVQKDPGTYEPRLVKLGRAGDRAWEILAGVAEGELVVTQGNMLIDGQAQLNQLGAPAAGEQPEASPGQPPLARDSSPAANPKQKCPVSGEELGSMGPVYIFTLNGTEFHLCCKACRKDIEKDPHKYLAGKQ